MEDKQLFRIIRQVNKVLRAAFVSIAMLLLIIIYQLTGLFWNSDDKTYSQPTLAEQEIIDGIHTETGLKEGAGLNLVIQNCTPCHSSKLIIQNRMSLDGWAKTIRWMQQTQNLWDLGENEELILTYLANNYAPTKKGRRAPLNNIEWYELD